jgi:hypothetical protein
MVKTTKEQGKMSVYYLKCLNCGEEFMHINEGKKYCPKCVAERERERKRKAYASYKGRKRPSIEIKTISQVLKELKAYNEANGTHLSYGQYVLMTEYQGVAKC